MRSIRYAFMSFLLLAVPVLMSGPMGAGEGPDAISHLAPRIWIVAKDGTGDFSSIQAAVSSSSAGDTIRVYAGTYVENVVIDKKLDVIGNGSALTVVDGNRADHRDSILINADGVNLTGFGSMNTYLGHEFGGISIRSSNNRVFRNRCWNNDYGVIVWVGNNQVFENDLSGNNRNGVHMKFTSNNVIEGNNCSSSGVTQGIWVEGSSYNLIANNTCCDNYKYGISLYQSDHNTLTNNTCSRNVLFHGINIYSSSFNVLTRNNCSGNGASGMAITNSVSNNITRNWLSSNKEGISVVRTSSCWAHLNSIWESLSFGVNATDNPDGPFNATMNWWGNESGPYHPVKNAAGSGDNVSDNVDFDPWMGEMEKNTPPTILTEDVLDALEDEEYSVYYSGFDADMDKLIWRADTNTSWLDWDTVTKRLHGTPDNSHVGGYDVVINVSDGAGGYDEHSFRITVSNKPPVILTQDIQSVLEDEPFQRDYDSSDDKQGNITWSLTSDCTWLSLDKGSGNLNGLPSDNDTGPGFVNISVEDGNGGSDHHNFTLMVWNMNDGPRPLSPPSTIELSEDSTYRTNITAWFYDADNDGLIYRVEGSENLSCVIEQDGMLVVIPMGNWSGRENISVYARDRVEEIGTHIEIEVSPVNDAPFDVKITPSNDRFFENGSQVLFGSARDVDIEYGDSFAFSWSTNITGPLGVGPSIDLGLLHGRYRVLLNVSDRAGAYAIDWIDIEVLKAKGNDTVPDDNGTDDDQPDDDITDDDAVDDDGDDTPPDSEWPPDDPSTREDEDWGMMLLLIATVLIVMLVVLGPILQISKGRSDRDPEE